MEAINILVDGLKAAQTASGKLNDWAQEASQLAEKGKALNEIQEVLNGVEFFGQASAVLGLFASGLDFILKLTGGPSPDQQIMKMVSHVSDQISNLSKHMDDRFDKLHAFVDYADSKNSVDKAVADMDTLKSQIAIYQTTLAKGEDVTDMENRLLEFKREAVQANVQLMAELCTGTSLVPNVLEKSYDYYLGDFNDIFNFGNSVLNYALFAVIADGVLSDIYYKRNNPSDHNNLVQQAAEDAQAFYSPIIVIITKAIQTWTNKCIGNANANLIEKSKKEFFPKLDLTNYNTASKYLTDYLKVQWFWLDFVAIVYEPVRGFQNHAFMATRNWCKLWFGINEDSSLQYSEDQKSNIAANIFIYWNECSAPVFPDKIEDISKVITSETLKPSLKDHYGFASSQDPLDPRPFMKEYFGSPSPVPAAIWAGGLYGLKGYPNYLSVGCSSTNPDRARSNQRGALLYNPDGWAWTQDIVSDIGYNQKDKEDPDRVRFYRFGYQIIYMS